jgi:hypothetical protein
MSNDLEARNAELEAEVERLRAKNELFRTEHKTAFGLAALLMAGPSLAKAFHSWFHVAVGENNLPVKETEDLAASITRRVIRVGFIGFLITLVPAGMLLWQNFLIRSQNKLIMDDSTRARRAQLIATIYDEDCSLKEQAAPAEGEGLDQEGDEEPFEEEGCPPKSHIRSRTEAAM